jgi:D-amino peptidase
MIEEGAKRALGDLSAVQPYDPGSPCTIEVEYKVTSAVDKLRHAHGVEIVDARRIRSTADTWWQAWQQFFFFG